MRKVKIKTLRSKLFLSFGLSSIGFCLFLILFAYQIMSTTITDNAEKSIKLATEDLSKQIENGNVEAVTISMIMAIAQENGLFGNRTASISYAHDILKKNKHFTGAYFGYEPNEDQNDSTYLANHKNEEKSMDKSGRFLPYWFINAKDKLELTPLIDMETSLYYSGCKEQYDFGIKKKAMITEPYFYEGKMIVEQTFPIVIDGKFAGIAGVDRSLADLQKLINSFKPYKTSRIVLISRKGKIISSNLQLASRNQFRRILTTKIKTEKNNIKQFQLSETMQTFNISDTNYFDILQIFYKMPKNTSYISVQKVSPLDGKKYFYSGSKISVGQWTVVMQVSESEIFAPLYIVCLKLFAAAVVFTLLLIFMVIKFSSRLTMIITKVVDASKKLALGNFDISLPRSSTSEIDTLTVSLTETGDKLKSLTQKIITEKEQFKKKEELFKTFFDILHNAIIQKDYSTHVMDDIEENVHTLSVKKALASLAVSETEAKDQDWLKTGRTELGDAISGERKIYTLCKQAITYIAGYLNIQVGAIFVKDDENIDFRLEASYAFRYRKGVATRFKKGEGLVGQAAYEKEIIIFSEIPDDYIRIESSFGNAVPKNILVVPFIFENEVQAVIELGSVFSFTELMIEFVELSGVITAVAINAALSGEKLEKLLEQTNEQSEKLKSQQNALKKSNIDLEAQAEELRQSESQLKVQQEELRATNEEMEGKNELLETRQKEIEKKNLDLEKTKTQIEEKNIDLEKTKEEIEGKNIDLEKTKKEIEGKNTDLEKTKTEIEKKAKQLELATKYKSEFLANMSHELRTPLNSMLLLAKMLSDNDENNLSEDQIDSAASIHRSGQNLLRLINDILDLSKIEARKIELSITDVNIQSFVSNLDIEFKHIAKEKGVGFEIYVETGLPEIITTDILRLEQIVRNLLSNAYKFTEEGTVSVKFTRPNKNMTFDRDDLQITKTVAVSVEDTGLGIPEDKIEAIFEAFRQVDGSISRSHGGTGLGLSISRELAALIGGELKVESTLGKGTVFTVYIPEVLIAPSDDDDNVTVPLIEEKSVKQVKKKTAPQVQKTIAPPVKQPPPIKNIPQDIKQEKELNEKLKTILKDKKVMLVDDDMRNIFALNKFLKSKGMKTSVANNGQKALDLLEKDETPDIILMDIMMPVMDGYEAMKKIRLQDRFKELPVLALTAKAMDSDRQECIDCGASDYLSKPLDTTKLLLMLGQWLEGIK